MLYRIDMQHYITHMIDYFSRDELINCKYVIVSNSVSTQHAASNVARIVWFCPTDDIRLNYNETGDKSRMRDEYMKQLGPSENDKRQIKKGYPTESELAVYKTIINPLLKHNDIILLSQLYENDYMDVLCEYLKNTYDIDCINLTKLFMTGSTIMHELNYESIKKHAYEIQRKLGKRELEELEHTEDGRMKLIKKLTKSEKLKRLHKRGIECSKHDDLDKLLMEEYQRQ